MSINVFDASEEFIASSKNNVLDIQWFSGENQHIVLNDNIAKIRIAGKYIIILFSDGKIGSLNIDNQKLSMAKNIAIQPTIKLNNSYFCFVSKYLTSIIINICDIQTANLVNMFISGNVKNIYLSEEELLAINESNLIRFNLKTKNRTFDSLDEFGQVLDIEMFKDKLLMINTDKQLIYQEKFIPIKGRSFIKHPEYCIIYSRNNNSVELFDQDLNKVAYYVFKDPNSISVSALNDSVVVFYDTHYYRLSLKSLIDNQHTQIG